MRPWEKYKLRLRRKRLLWRAFRKRRELEAISDRTDAIRPGAVLLCAGAKGKRSALKHARVMIHQPMGGFRGQASDVEIHAREILYLKQKLNKMLAQHTGQTIETIERDTDRDNFLSAEDAVKYGLADQVLAKRA